MNPCPRCGCPTVSGHVHAAASPAQRATWHTAGIRRRVSRGLCAACRGYVTRHGQLDAYPAAGTATLRTESRDPTATPCARHGAGDLCGDCTATVTAMDELERWTA